MTWDKTWYTLEEAVSKFGLERDQILAWVEEGLVRAEEEGKKVVRVNSDDLALKVEELSGI